MILVVDNLDEFITEVPKKGKVRISVEEGEANGKSLGHIMLTAKEEYITRLDIYIESKNREELGVDVATAIKEIHGKLDAAKIEYAPGGWFP